MRSDVPVHIVSDLEAFPACPFIDDSHREVGPCKISHDGSWAWIVRNSFLEIFSTQKVERKSYWSFGTEQNTSRVNILSVVEFYNNAASPQLLMVLDTVNLLCLFDVNSSTVIRAVHIPHKIHSIEVVSTRGGACIQTRPLATELRYMFGIVAVGVEGGQIFLVDLCLDEDCGYTNDLHPGEPFFASAMTLDLGDKREEALNCYQHMTLKLNEDHFHRGNFLYRGTEGEILTTFSSSTVSITSMKYIPHLTLLVVGFNFGGFQLWNLQKLLLEYTSSFEPEADPITHFAFQEPENDPRNYCYLWVARGQAIKDIINPNITSVAALYSLGYQKKEWIENHGFIYQGMQSCIHRLTYPLTTQPLDISFICSYGSRIISFHCIQQGEIINLPRADLEELHGDDFSNQDLSLCVIVWEAWTAATSPTYFLALFDINQWYQAQMPSNIRSHNEQCSYFGVFSLMEVQEKLKKSNLLDAYISPSSFVKYKSLSGGDEMYFPSSLAFKAACASECGIVNISYLGTQRQVLFDMEQLGPSCLINPTALYNLCVNTSLLPVSSEVLNNINLKRETLLTLALNFNLFKFITSCIWQWSSVDFSKNGLTLKFLLNWIWKRVTLIKNSTDKICVPLFNYSGQQLEQNSLTLLHSYATQLERLSSVLKIMQSHTGPITETGLIELQTRQEVTQLIATFQRVVLWLYYCSLLPEHAEGEAYGENEVAYPASTLLNSYSQRRKDVQMLHSSVSQTDLLLIDGMMSSFGELPLQWEKSGNNCLYPPPSLYALLGIYLVKGPPLEDKHCLMLYLLLDMAAFLSDKQSHLEEKLMKFPAAFKMSHSRVKLTQGFWMLDHRDFEEAILFFTDPVVMPGDILPWQHIRILKSFLYQGEHQKALKYIKICKPSLQTPEEVKLHLTTLLANKLIAEAFQYQRQCCDDRNTEDLLTHFFLGCQQTGNMDALLQLPFSSSEEESLIQFLFNSEETFHKDLLVAHFLQRSQPLEAARVNERIKLPLMEGDSHSKERVLIRSSLVSGFLRTLPAMQSKLATEVGKHHLKMTSIFSNATCPVPLSTKIHRDTVNVITQSSKLYELMTRVKDTWSINKVTDHSPLRSNKPDSLVWRSEGFPFIETPGTQRKPKKVESEVVFATPLAKRKMTEFGDSSKMQVPQKKFKGMDHFTPHSRNDGDRRSCRSISSEVLSLLQTPPVKRIIPPIRVRTLERVSAPITDTPPSILKVRQLIKRSATPPSVSRILNYPDLDKDIVKDNYDDEVEKNLRFDVPVIGRDSPTGSEWSTTPEKTSELELSEAAISSVGSSLKSSLQSRHNTTQSSINSTFGGPSFHNSDEVIDEDEDITINFSVHKRREISFVLDKEVSFIKPQIPKPILSKEVIVEESSQSAKPHLKSLDREKTSKTISFMEEPIDKNIIREGSPKSTSLNQEGKPRTISFMEHVPQSSSSLSLEPKEEMVYFEPVSTVQSSITNATPSSTILKQQNLSKKLTHSPLMPSLEKSTLSSFPLKRDLSPVLIKITSGANLNKEIEESVNSGSTINISPLIPTPRPQITRSPLKEDTTDELLVKNDEDDVSSNELQLSESGNEIEEINDEENLDENNQAELQNTPSPDILDSDIDEGIGDNFAEVIVSTSNETNLKNLPSVKLSPSKPNESLRKTPDNLDVSKSESIKTISPIKDSVINSDLQISNRQSSPKIVLGETISKVKNTVETKSLHMTRATEKQVNISMNKEGSPKILRKEGYKNSKTSPKKEMTKKVEDADESGLEKSIKAVKSLLTEAFETAQSVGTDERKSKRMAKIKSLSSLDDRDLSTEKPKLTRQTRSLRSNRKELKSEEEKLSESGDSSMILRSNSKEQKPSDEANISLNLRNSKVISKGKKTNVKMKDQNESFVSASPTASEASDKVFLSPEKDTSISWTPRLRLRSRADSMSSIESSPANITKELASKSSKVSKIKSSILSTVLDINPQKKTGRKAKKKDNILSQDISVIPEDSILESENTSMKQTTALPFVFSPPSTRSRTRRKKSDSFSEPASFYEAPAIQETSSSKPSHKKTGPIPPWECFLNVISPAQEVAEATTKKTRTSIASSLSSRHGMQLRKGPFKTRKKVKL